MARVIVIPKPDKLQLRGALIGALIVLVLAGLWTSVYTVETEEVGVVTRFGRYIQTAQPGLKFKLPFGIDRVNKVAVERQLKEEFGFRTVSAGVRTQYDSRDYSNESLMVTGDLNAADVEWSVQYRIDDPIAYSFNVREIRGTLRNASESVMREIVGDRTVDEVLTVGRLDVEQQSRQKLQELMDRYEMGIRIDQLVLQDVNPPEPVRTSFNDVNEAQQQREQMINEARAEYNQVVPRASGEAQQQIQQAEGYAIERVNRAQGDAERFNAQFAAYSQAPEVTIQRLYLETMQTVLPAMGRKVLLDAEARSVLPLLQLPVESAPRPAAPEAQP